jgi:hypothetical protein
MTILFNSDLPIEAKITEERTSKISWLALQNEAPLITLNDSSNYSEKFINSLKKLNQFKSIELIDDKIIVDKKDTFLFPKIENHMIFTAKKNHIAVALTINKINFTNIEYKVEIVEFGNSSITEKGIAEIQPHFFIDSLTAYDPNYNKSKINVTEFYNTKKGCHTLIRLGNLPNIHFCRLIKNCNNKIQDLTEENYNYLHRKN